MGKSVLLTHPNAWEKIWRDLGTKIAMPIGRMPRDEAMAALREQNWTLEKIGDAFGITRERVRQLTDPYYAQRPEQEINQATLGKVFKSACYNERAWTQKGLLSTKWLARQLGLDYRSKAINALGTKEEPKLIFLLKYGMGLKTRDEQLAQLHEWQFGEDYHSYDQISKLLSKRFVPISTMAVYRGASQLGHKGHTSGAPGQMRSYRYIDEHDLPSS